MTPPLALIVEDNVELASLFTRAIEAAGFTAEVCHDGETAINKIATITPTIALIDLHLPQISGEAVIRAIQASPNLQNTHIIIASADARMVEALRDQVDLALLKPVNFSQLRALATRLKSQIQ